MEPQGRWVLGADEHPPAGSMALPSPPCSPGMQREGSILPTGRKTAPLGPWLWERGPHRENKITQQKGT